MKLLALAAYFDNNIWMLHGDRQATVVDPGAAVSVAAALVAFDPAPASILVTHHRSDPVSGLAARSARPRAVHAARPCTAQARATGPCLHGAHGDRRRPGHRGPAKHRAATLPSALRQ